MRKPLLAAKTNGGIEGMNWIGRIVGGAAVALALGAGSSAPAASAAGPEFLAQFGEGSTASGAGQTQIPRGIASDPRNGHLFVADQQNKRVDEFTAWGTFVKAFGWDVAPGAVNESQEVRFKATSGQFELTFGASTTAPLQYNAGAKAVQEALNGLSSIAGAGGEVNVSFNPSNDAGASPYVYVLTFKGGLAATDVAQVSATDLSLSGGVPSTGLEASTRANGAPGGTGLEACTTESGCKSGSSGPGTGQFASTQSVAVDSAGDVYVVDRPNHRVQKFSPAGEFLRMWGKGVNTGTGANKEICTNAGAPTDVCGAGGEGAGNGQFGAWAVLGSYIAVGPSNKVYVGDVGRIQVFNSEGEYQSQIAEGIVAGEKVKSLAVDPSGNLYAAICLGECLVGELPKANVREWSSSGTYLGETVTVASPFALATDPGGNLYVVSGATNPTIFEFNPAHAKIAEFGKGEFTASTGIGTNAAGDVYVANEAFSNSYLRAYGPEPSALEPPPDSKPEVGEEYATSVGTTSAVLKATITPHFWATRYFVQYGPEECETAVIPCAEKPLPPGSSLGVTNKAASATVAIEGLGPGKTYHFRFLAESEAPSSQGHPTIGADSSFSTYPTPAPNTSCANQALRNGASAQLPDCRGYEMVSPVDKNGGDADAYEYEGFEVEEFRGLDQSAQNGEELAYTADTAFAGAVSNPFVDEYLASRHEGADGSGSWSSAAISPPGKGGNANGKELDSEYKAFSPDLRYGWVVPETGLALAPCATEGFRNLYRRDDESGEYTAMCSAGAGAENSHGLLRPEPQGYSANAGRAAFRVSTALTPEAAKGLDVDEAQLYEWAGGETVRLVSVLPNGSAFQGTSTAGTEGGLGFTHEATLRATRFGSLDTVTHALSSDGTRVYWTASHTPTNPTLLPTLYLRVNAEQPQSAISGGKCVEPEMACTVQVSPPSQVPQFWDATPDGSHAIYSIAEGAKKGDLYEYEYDEAEGKGASTLIAGETLGVMGASEGLSYLYFASDEAIAGAKANAEGEAPVKGQPNLYLDREGSFTFVGALSAEDLAKGIEPTPSPLSAIPRYHDARVSADGRHLAFVSAAPLTKFEGRSYDNADVVSGEADREAYVYEAGGQLRCASCNPSGSRPRGANLQAGGSSFILPTAAWIPGYQGQLYGRRPLSEDGSRLFFNAVDSLSPNDSNGAQDVYEWEALGAGPAEAKCTKEDPTFSPQDGGCISLISSGESPEDSEFVDASTSGRDVFIRTESSLAPQDPGSVDIYDAREGGGEPRSEEAQACEGDSCSSPPSSPSAKTPASNSYQGPGDVRNTPLRCPRHKRKVRKAGKARCAPKKHKAKHHRKKQRRRHRTHGRAGL